MRGERFGVAPRGVQLKCFPWCIKLFRSDLTGREDVLFVINCFSKTPPCPGAHPPTHTNLHTPKTHRGISSETIQFLPPDRAIIKGNVLFRFVSIITSSSTQVSFFFFIHFLFSSRREIEK